MNPFIPRPIDTNTTMSNVITKAPPSIHLAAIQHTVQSYPTPKPNLANYSLK